MTAQLASGLRERTPAPNERDASAFEAEREDTPVFAPFLVCVTVARAVVAMLPIGLFFAGAADPSTASRSIGLASGMTLGIGLALWPSGRQLDRIGCWRGLHVSLFVGAVALSVLNAGIAWSWPIPVLGVCAVAAGACLAPTMATPRVLLPRLVPAQRLAWASGVEAASFEVALIVAPVAAAVVGRLGAMAVMATASGVLVLTWLLFPRTTDTTPRRVAPTPLMTRPVTRLAGLAALLGVSGGLLEPALASLAPPIPQVAESNALLFVAVGLGSALGGLLAARTGWPHTAAHAAPLFGLHAFALVVTAAVDPALRLITLAVAGFPIAPLTSLAGLHLDRWSEPRRAGETFGVITSVLVVATGLGQAVAAHVIAHVPAVHLVLWSAGPPLLASGLVVTHVRHRLLR